jgi:hypothetical protein
MVLNGIRHDDSTEQGPGSIPGTVGLPGALGGVVLSTPVTGCA